MQGGYGEQILLFERLKIDESLQVKFRLHRDDSISPISPVNHFRAILRSAYSILKVFYAADIIAEPGPGYPPAYQSHAQLQTPRLPKTNRWEKLKMTPPPMFFLLI